MMVRCPYCGEPVGENAGIGFRDTCGRCGRDLHVCRNCRFHDPGAYNECREPQAERVLDKDRANFCEYFAPLSDPSPAGTRGSSSGTEDDARKHLESLFKSGGDLKR
ncbi:MAG TPA: hypothetical protein ENN35_01785 [Deltaproteobacteria bacterium]|nr:hypothetical protein [Deltaproteobacteria bacterium]